MAKRMIRIDNDTIVGYNYMLSKYYVTNKGTSTYRKTEQRIKEVLDIVAPSNTVTIEDLTNIRVLFDTLQEMYYTWSDDGSYIKALQLNDYENNPIVLDCEKKKLYIMNTNLIFDLTTTESNKERCLYLQSYFKEQIGLSLTYQQLLSIYNFLISFYKPYVFNYIEDINTTPLTYSNKFAIANYQETKKLKAQYLCTCNPDNEFTYPKLVNILSTTSNTITTKTPITIPTNTTIKVAGTTTTTDSYTLSADGEYTVKEILNNTITTNEAIPYSYTIPYPTCKYISSTTNIQSINRETNTITLTTLVPNTLQVGNIIHVNNTQQEVEGETVSCDGTYTISSISSNTITTQETIPTNYTYTEGTTYPTISKQILLGNVETINNKTLTFTSTLPMQPVENSKILLTINNTSTLLTVITTTPTTIRVVEGIEDYTTTYPQLQQPTPVTNILVYVDSTDSDDLFPIGEFMVDNFTQCQQYLSTYLSSEYIPTTSTYNLVNKPVPTTYPNPPIEGVSMKLKGVYSKVYKDVEE